MLNFNDAEIGKFYCAVMADGSLHEILQYAGAGEFYMQGSDEPWYMGQYDGITPA